ncbi:MAG: hypothetical protein GY949_11415 [Gammaproteobacteria bacterium]|nr:hypothetical protein [Gammaproteobacteria bacterium]
MTISLVSLTFNHNPQSARTSALNIRRNAQDIVRIPEWRAGDADSFPAAYSIFDTAGAAVEVKVDLTGPANTRVYVRAIPASSFTLNVLGQTETIAVNFPPNGVRRNVGLRLLNPLFVLIGVGVYDVAWRWQARRGLAGRWRDFGTSRHRIYVVLRQPTRPWLQQPFTASNTQLPWAEVLDWSCRWGALAKSTNIAAVAITAAVSRLGLRRIAYDCRGGNPTNYSYPDFDCTAFLERLSGGYGRGPRVNCSDCATIVSTFANAIGTDLWQSRMFNQIVPFRCNLMRPIGAPFFGAVCGSGLFNYHEVAWEGLCSDFDDIYDACIEVFAPAPPAVGYTTYIPANVNFGWTIGSSYRDFLVSPEARLICQAQPQTRRRRFVY